MHCVKEEVPFDAIAVLCSAESANKSRFCGTQGNFRREDHNEPFECRSLFDSSFSYIRASRQVFLGKDLYLRSSKVTIDLRGIDY